MTESTAEILKRKKKELEQEIADFRNTKEDEYRAFERQLARGVRDSVRGVEGTEDGKRPEKQDSLATQENAPHRELSVSKTLGFESFNATVRAQELGDLVSETLETAADSSHFDRSRGWQEGHPGSLDKIRLHERELEFQGLFTPSFLPLLDCKDRHRSVAASGQNHIGNDLPSISFDIGKGRHGSDARKTKLSLSSSASFPNTHHSSSLSPPTVRPISASVPRQPPHQRRSSSRSDTSIASLRSSLRDPKQPRSPKRVLFSIGDTLVSPSTSPLMQRAISEPGIINAPSSVSRDEPESTRSQSDVWDMFPWMKKSVDSAPVGTAPAGFLNAQPQPFSAGVSIKSPILGGEDFERIETEYLFAFDEDLTIRRSKREEGDREATNTGSDENEDSDEPLPADSPHAGSLPIEIKWPLKFMSPS